MAEGRAIVGKISPCDAKTNCWYIELNEPSNQEISVLHRPVGLKLESISLFIKMFTCKLSLTPEIMPGIWPMLVSRLMVVYIPVIFKIIVKTIIGGNLTDEVAHGYKIVTFKQPSNNFSKRACIPKKKWNRTGYSKVSCSQMSKVTWNLKQLWENSEQTCSLHSSGVEE